ncbi:hypothetical protein ACTLSG_005319, partial [Escherichia coli]
MNRPLTDFGGKTSIFSHPVYLFLRKFSLQDSRGGSINAYYNVYRPHTNNGGLSPCRMKKNGNRLFRCPDFMIHYTFLTNATA